MTKVLIPWSWSVIRFSRPGMLIGINIFFPDFHTYAGLPETAGVCNISHTKSIDPKEEMGRKKEPEQNRVAIRICPECAKAFLALESEDAACGFCGAQMDGKPNSESSIKDALSQYLRR